MLVVSRKVDEEVIVRDASGKVILRILVVAFRRWETGPWKVRLGFEGDRSLSIYRKELDDERQADQRRNR